MTKRHEVYRLNRNFKNDIDSFDAYTWENVNHLMYKKII